MSGELIKLLAADIPVKRICDALEANPNLWRENTWRQSFNGSCHSDTESVFLRWATSNTAEAIQQSTESIEYPALSALPEARELLEMAFDLVDGKELGRALIVKLKPFGKIYSHIDEGKYADHFERFHLCLQTYGSEFFVSNRQGEVSSAAMKSGDLWWFNHKETHWAENRSTIPRINLIIDAASPKHRRERVQF